MSYEDKEKFKEKIKSMAHVATFEEVKAYWDKEVSSEEEHWGKDYIYSRWAREARDRALEEFKKGNPVEFYKEYEHFGYGTWGEDVDAYLYSDGTYKISSHSAD